MKKNNADEPQALLSLAEAERRKDLAQRQVARAKKACDRARDRLDEANKQLTQASLNVSRSMPLDGVRKRLLLRLADGPIELAYEDLWEPGSQESFAMSALLCADFAVVLCSALAPGGKSVYTITELGRQKIGALDE